MVKKGVPVNEKVPLFEVQDELIWTVCEKYCIEHNRVKTASRKKKGVYNPLDVPNLFQQFAQMFNDIKQPIEGDIESEEKWNRQSEKIILKWVSKYGELHNLGSSGIVGKDFLEQILEKTSVDYYRKEVGRAYQALNHYKAFLDTKGDGYYNPNGLRIYKYTFNWLLEETPLTNVQLGLKLEGNPPEFRPLYIPDSLLTALWLQFWQTVTGQNEMGQCKCCGRSFTRTHGRSGYCPPDGRSVPWGTNKSACANKYNQWLHGKKEDAIDLFKRGKSVKNVTAVLSQAKYHIEEAKVQEWWEEWLKDN